MSYKHHEFVHGKGLDFPFPDIKFDEFELNMCLAVVIAGRFSREGE